MNTSQKKAKAAARKNDKRAAANYKEHITNLYMLHFSFGILGIIILAFYGSLYKNSAVVYMDIVSWVLTAVFAVLGIALVLLGKFNKIKNQKRAKNYGIFMFVCAVVSLWFALYNKLRVVIESVLRTITGNGTLSVYSYWNYRLPMILIGAYLIIGFIVYLIKVLKK